MSAGEETVAIDASMHRPGPDLMFYIGASAEARTRLALSKVGLTPKSIIVLPRAGSASVFSARYRQRFSSASEDNVVPLVGPRRPRIIAMTNGPRALLDTKDCDRIFFEALETRPADITKALTIATSLGRLALEKRATVLAGLFAASDAEALLLEQGLVDLGIPKENIVAGWLNGIGNSAIRYVRVPAWVLMDRGLPDPTDKTHDASLVVDFKLRSSKKGTRP